MPRKPPTPIAYGRHEITAADVRAVLRVLRGQPLTCGPAVEAFEQAIKDATGARHAVAVSNGTSALRLLYQACGIGPGVRVGVPAITFVATASQALLLGAEVVLLDVDPDTLVLTPAILERCRERLDVVVPVHLAGRLCDMAGLAEVARRRGAYLLEDGAHAFGSAWSDGRRCGDGTWSRGAIFSFHPVKSVTTGEGGAVATNDAAVAAAIRRLRHHGIVREGFSGDLAAADGGAPWYHEFHAPATNERLSDLHAALGVSQIARLAAITRARQRVHDAYHRRLADVPWLRLPPPAAGQRPCWHLFAAQVDWKALGRDRRSFFAAAAAAGIHPQVHYIPLHHQPALKQATRADALAGADAAYRGLVSLPCYPGLGRAELGRVDAFVRGVAVGTGRA
ncbi:MAG TPA: DegT/DnrJ/EryC1/StrS family aminotransferase [Planctomycetota bacterium]|nr:DegT/DnrJ/EryC1/StrS family aminotransferase [Planctomycetota bacterium]